MFQVFDLDDGIPLREAARRLLAARHHPAYERGAFAARADPDTDAQRDAARRDAERYFGAAPDPLPAWSVAQSAAVFDAAGEPVALREAEDDPPPGAL
jgi:hypothetical protein